MAATTLGRQSQIAHKAALCRHLPGAKAPRVPLLREYNILTESPTYHKVTVNEQLGEGFSRCIVDSGKMSNTALQPGQILEGKYRIERLLGEGGMGLVYQAHHTLLKKPVAIKVLRPEMATIADVRERFEAEAQAAAAIGHPNIVAVTDMGRDADGLVFFVMDLLKGESLGERLHRTPKLDVAATVAIALDVLQGLGAAHAVGLIHRDLKPDNIFLTSLSDGREVAQILDFGVAKALSAVGQRANQTQAGLVVGTPAYMSPEQVKSPQDIDSRSDLYALGVTLYQCLSGRVPFDGFDVVAVMAGILHGTPPSLQSLAPHVSLALAQVVEAAMSRDRDRRPANASDLAGRIRAAMPAAPKGPITTPQAHLGDQTLDALNSLILDSLTGGQHTGVPAPKPHTSLYPAFPDSPPTAVGPSWQREPAPTPIELEHRPTQSSIHSKASTMHRRTGTGRRIAFVLAGLVLLAGAGAALWPRSQRLISTLLRSTAPPSQPSRRAALPVRATVPVTFIVSPPESAVFLDGRRLSTPTVSLGIGEFHTVNAVLEGYTMAIYKFSVQGPETIPLQLEPLRKNR
jgi:serine/threonine-protein kinase